MEQKLVLVGYPDYIWKIPIPLPFCDWQIRIWVIGPKNADRSISSTWSLVWYLVPRLTCVCPILAPQISELRSNLSSARADHQVALQSVADAAAQQQQALVDGQEQVRCHELPL